MLIKLRKPYKSQLKPRVVNCRWCGAEIVSYSWIQKNYCPGEPGSPGCSGKAKAARNIAQGKTPAVSFERILTTPGMEFLRDGTEGPIRLTREQKMLAGR